MRFYSFHLMPWPHLPADFADRKKHPAAWVTLSNRNYDPVRGHDLYNRYLDELEYAEKLGFDGGQLHDDDVVPADLDWAATQKGVAEVKKLLDGEGLFAEFIAPRLWEHPRTIDGGYTVQ